MSCPPISVGSALLIFVVSVAGSAANLDEGEVEVVAAVAEERSEVEATEEGAGTIEVHVVIGDATDVVIAEIQVVGGSTPTGEVEVVAAVAQRSDVEATEGAGMVEVHVAIGDATDVVIAEVQVVGMGGSNGAPTLSSIGDQTVSEGASLTLTLSGSDPDDDVLTYAVSGNPSGSSLSGNTFTWTPGSDQSGSYTVTFTVSDDNGASASETITITMGPTRPGVADFNFDGFVEWDDLFMFADAWLKEDFDPIFDLNEDGELDEHDLSLFVLQWGQAVGGEPKTKQFTRSDPLAREGTLQLELTRADDEIVEFLLRVDGASVLGSGAFLRYDDNAFRLKRVTDVRSVAASVQRKTLLTFERPGEVLLVVDSPSNGAATEGALAHLAFTRLSAQDRGGFRIAEAALLSTDGTVTQPRQFGDAEIRSTPQTFTLDRNYPNPFNSSTTIPYRLAAASAVQLDLLDIAGRKVRTILAENQELGFREITWDGRDEAGVLVGAGVYFYRLTALPLLTGESAGGQREFAEVRKLMLLK